jgi:UDP-3-O-[3-hydroxymyristoyl] glucosamine N-acyltransferase
MPDFVKPNRELTTGEIAALTRAKLRDGDPSERRIGNIAPLDTATASDISFLDNSKYRGELAGTRAGACLIAPRFAATAAHVHHTARIEANVTIDPLAVIGPRAQIGADSVIAAGAVIGPDVCIGRECAIGAAATIMHALVGDRVIVHPGTRIGQDGFGYLPSPKGHQKIPQTKRVIIQDDVEIGANCTIDRGGTRDTVIGEGTKIDNLVQIGHNCSIGRHCLIVSQVGISGSVTMGDFVVLAGQVGVGDHLTIGMGAVLGAKAGVMSNVPAGARWGGFPAEAAMEWKRGVATVRQMVRRGRKSGPESEGEGE